MKNIKKVVKKIIKILHFVFTPHRIISEQKFLMNAYERIINESSSEIENSNNDLTGVIFSKDRPIQLYALIESYYKFVKNPAPIHVIYNCSDKSYRLAYDELFKLFGDKISSKVDDSSGFKGILVTLLKSMKTKNVFCLVDDIIFKRDIDLEEFNKFDTSKYVPSLRHGDHLKFCYTQNKSQKLPIFNSVNLVSDDKICWNWNDGDLDWGYPLSVDGHIFNRIEFLIMSETLEYKAPNTFEGALQKFNGIFKNRIGIAYKKSAIFNNPCNIVQGEAKNIHGNIHQDELLKMWRAGKKIDYIKFYNFENSGVHHYVDFEFIDRY